MDQDDTKGQDKRNWRERLGIGAQGNAAAPVNNGAQGSRDLPKISNDFRKEPAPASARPVPPRVAPRPVVAAPAVRPAPMAPRANAKVINPPASPDKLAERLRSQRDASTKLAEQRVQVAKQRAENPPIHLPAPAPPRPQAVVPGAPKPKFTFAEEGEAKAATVAPAPAPSRPAMPPPVIQQPVVQPQLPPARPPLGGGVPPVVPAFQPRPQQTPQQPPAFQPQVPLGYPSPGQMPPGFPQGYGQQPVPPYRPIDPASGYVPPSGYQPQQRGFGVPPQQGGFTPPSGPRLNVPPRPTPGLNSNYQPQQDFGAAQPPAPGNYSGGSRMARAPLRGPVPPQEQDEGYEEESFEEAAQQPTRSATRPTSNDYQQAYREAEYGYEDEAPRSKAPWILASLLLLALLIAGLGVLGYQKYWKPMITGQTTTQDVPAVAAPETPAKVEAEQPAATPSTGVATPTKKQIYDRIVGDQEILGGEVSTPTETPAAIPEPTPSEQVAPSPAQPSGSGSEDSAPLPIPPPPAGTGGQQGSLEPASEKQSAELITPAAGESQAAVVAETPPPPSPVANPPAPGEIAATEPVTRSLASESAVSGTEAISDVTDLDPLIKKKIIEKKKIQPVKEKAVSTKLGSKPVVLVAPARKPRLVAPKQLDSGIASSNSVDTSGGLFGDEPVPGQTPVVTVDPPVKKKRTLADLFKRAPVEAPAQDQVAAIDKPVVPVQRLKPLALQAPPAEPTSVSSGGDFVVQLASFRSRQEATTEFTRLKARNARALGQFSPIISEANVGGSTRFRLSVGRMATQAQANAVCSSLFAGGERDCLVKRR